MTGETCRISSNKDAFSHFFLFFDIHEGCICAFKVKDKYEWPCNENRQYTLPHENVKIGFTVMVFHI